MKPPSEGPLGILGGTFDPVHIGHLRAALEVAEVFNLKGTLLIPAGIPPHKVRDDITPFKDRYEMIKRAIEGEKMLSASDLEGRRPGPSYTVDTLSYFYENGIETRFILGSEAFLEIHTWKDYRRLFEMSDFLILLRKKGHLAKIKAYLSSLNLEILDDSNSEWTLSSHKKIVCYQTIPIDVSGSLIRKLRQEGKSIRYLVPDSVYEYIVENRLYLRG